MELVDDRYPDAVLSDDRGRVDLDRVHAWLREAYWCRGIPRETIARAVEGSIAFGIYEGGVQVAFARAVTDRATYAWIADVIVAPESRGRGYGKWIVEAVLAHPELQGLRRIQLGTLDAHGLYAQYGFVPTAVPERFMEIVDRDVYQRGAAR